MSTKKEKQIEIFIPLLDEGTNVVRPTLGEKIRENIYRILPTDNYDSEDEKWKYLPGTVVRCEIQKWEGKELFVAVEQIEI